MSTYRERLGFRDGNRGAHFARTIMSAELGLLLTTLPADSGVGDYRRAVLEENALGKRTASNRRESFKRLSQLYGLDPELPIFRYFRFLWELDAPGRPLVTFLCAYARDPLLRLTAPPVLGAGLGEAFSSNEIQAALAAAAEGRLSETSLRSIARNAASSWAQSGHLRGKVNKRRSHPTVTPGAVAFALFLGYLEGVRAGRLFETEWTRLLEAPRERLEELAREASRRGWLDYLQVDDVVEVRFPGRLTPEEESRAHEPD